MSKSYFKPEMNKLYGLCFWDGTNWWAAMAGNDGSITFVKEGDDENKAPDASTFSSDKLWQFFEIADNSYVIANYGNGLLISLSADGSNNISLDTLSERTLVSSPVLDGAIALCVTTQNSAGVITARENEESVYYTYLEASYYPSWYIIEGKSNPTTLTVDTPNAIEAPSFSNDVAPLVYPATPLLINSVRIPYFFINDSSMSYLQRIQQSPYYILRQYGQYKLSTSLNNISIDTTTFVEEWQHGWSDTIAAGIEGSIGIKIGGSIEANEIFAKETITGEVNAQLGISLTMTAEQSESQMKEIRVEMPPNSSMAVYGTTSKFELYQTNGNFPISKPPTPLQMENGFMIISNPAPST